MNHRTRLRLLAIGLGIAATAAPLWAAGTGHLVALTLRVTETMAGGPAIPTRTLHKKVCVAPGDFDPRAFTRAESGSDCRIEHYRKAGQVVSFDMTCSKPEPVTSHGEFHMAGSAAFTGTMHTAFSAAGHAITVDTDYTGTPAGSCAYTAPQASN